MNEKNDQLINDISKLQQIEKDMYAQLSSDNKMTLGQKEILIEKINQISQMRINMYRTLESINSFYTTNLSGASDTLNEQTRALKIVEEQLNEAKQRINYINGQRVNQMRKVEINKYYSEWYNERVELIKIAIYFIIAIIILLLVRRAFPYLGTLYNIIFVILVFVALYFALPILLSITYRNNVIYSEYDFAFNKDTAPKIAGDLNNRKNNPWQKKESEDTCIGEQCCPTGLKYDHNTNQCTIGAYNGDISKTSTAGSNSNNNERGDIFEDIYNNIGNAFNFSSNVNVSSQTPY
jgi:hypothetical protein